MDISPAFDSYLLGLLAKQPEDRPSAQQVSDWFRTDAWRGRPEPLPHHAAAAPRPATHVPPAPAPGAQAAGGPSTYRLPQSGGRRRAAPAPRTSRSAARSATTRRISTSEAIRRRPRVASAVAGTVAFLAAVYLGTILFAPDTGAADTPDPGSSPTAGLESPAPTGPAVEPAQDGEGEDD